jgi:lantibiotic biosynthesis protein
MTQRPAAPNERSLTASSARSTKSPLLPAGFFVLRTPLLPFDELLACADGLRAASAVGADDQALQGVLDEDRRALRERMRAWCDRAEVREALLLASPSLEQSLDEAWSAAPDSKASRNVERALWRYFSRMAFRATPFGLFAGWSLGRLGDATDLRLGPRAYYVRRTRADHEVLSELAGMLARDPRVRNRLVLYPSSSLYATASGWRYVEHAQQENGRRYHLVALGENDVIDRVIAEARAGARPSALARAVRRGVPEITQKAATAFIHQLVDTQVLVSDLEPPITGPQAIDDLITQLVGHPETADVAARLDRLRQGLVDVDRAGLGIPRARYVELARSLEPEVSKIDLGRAFQVDLYKPAPESTLGNDLVLDVERGVNVLLSMATRAIDEPLMQFRDAFVRRYEDADVPLTTALDAELGVGFTSETSGERTAVWSPRDSYLLERLYHVWARGERVLDLTAEDLRALSVSKVEPPVSLSVTAIVSAPADAGSRFEVLIQNVTQGAARVLGRFCHSDPQLTAHVRGIIAAEQAAEPDAIHAEVVHLPQGRAGNVTARPVLRDYEIPFLGRGGAARENQITVDDLRVSVRQGRVVLRSTRLGREVIPCLSSAHDFERDSLGMYSFLCRLGRQGTGRRLGWDWGALEQAPFLPRVRMGTVALHRARWRLTHAELLALRDLDGARCYRAVRALAERRGLPRHFVLADGDQQLWTDLDNPLAVDAFAQLVRQRDHAIVFEDFGGEGGLCASGPEGRFRHEVIVPFVRREPVVRATPSAPPKRDTAARSFAPGSEWLYLKLYCGAAACDQILRDVIAPSVRRFAAKQAIDHWFFVRYADPDSHLRIRLHGRPDRLHADVLPSLEKAAAKLLRAGIGWKLELETYIPETHRYGGADARPIAERIFGADSDAVVQILGARNEIDSLGGRWMFAARSTHQLLEDLQIDPDHALTIVTELRESLARRQNLDAELERELSRLFRTERPRIEELLDRTRDRTHPLASSLRTLARRSHAIAPLTRDLQKLANANRLTVPIGELAKSFVHMHLNRMLSTETARNELVVYDMLLRCYRSQVWARSQPGSS